MIESPCVKVCTLDAQGSLCLGCYRTIDEIGAWAAMSDRERAAVMARLGTRRREHLALQQAAVVAGTAQSCQRCGGAFTCGALDPAHPCWCAACPPVKPAGSGARCLCPACLARAASPGG